MQEYRRIYRIHTGTNHGSMQGTRWVSWLHHDTPTLMEEAELWKRVGNSTADFTVVDTGDTSWL